MKKKNSRIWPKKWERREKILVTGETIAFITAISSIFLTEPVWLLNVAASISTFALLYYAIDLASMGKR